MALDLLNWDGDRRELFHRLCVHVLEDGGGAVNILTQTMRRSMILRDVEYCCNALHPDDQPKFLRWMSKRYHVSIPIHLRSRVAAHLALSKTKEGL